MSEALPEKAAHVLCRAYKRGDYCGGPVYFIDRTLGVKASATGGKEGRPDIAPLYAAGLVKEWFTPWTPPLYLTDKGMKVRTALRKELGYDD